MGTTSNVNGPHKQYIQVDIIFTYISILDFQEESHGCHEQCVAFIYGAHGEEGHDNPERDPFRAHVDRS